MASEILGLFASPELYQQQQNALMQQQAAQYANLNPYERIEYGANLAGRRLGGTLGRMLGGEDPQLKIISARQSVMQGVDPSNPESILNAAQQLAEVGDQQGALTLADYARKAQSELALQQQRMREGRAASTPKEVQIASARAQLQDQIRQLQALPESPERDNALQVARDTLTALQPKPEGLVREQQLARDFALAKGAEGSEEYKTEYTKRLETLTSKATQEKLGEFERILNARYPDTPENAAARNALMDSFLKGEAEGRAKGKGTTVSVSSPTIQVDTGKAGEAAGKILGTELVDVKGKESALDSIAEARSILNKGIYAGAYGPTKQFVAKYTGIGSAEKVANTETFLAFIGETVVPRLKEFGGNDSEQELAYLNRIMGGDISVEPKALARILDSAERKINRGIERLRRQVQSGENKQSLTTTLPPPRPEVMAPAPAPAPAAPAATQQRAPKRVKFGDLPQ